MWSVERVNWHSFCVACLFYSCISCLRFPGEGLMAAKTKEQGGSIETQQEHTTIAKEMEEGHVGEHNGEMDAQRRHPCRMKRRVTPAHRNR